MALPSGIHYLSCIEPTWVVIEYSVVRAGDVRGTGAEIYILEAEVNGVKSLIFGNKGIIASDRWRDMKNDITDPGVALHYIKATLAVWDYLRDREVKASRTLLPAWDEWYVDWVHYHLRRTKDFVGMAIKDMYE
ncbi:hypothetical protein BJX63DRAFT_437795 [Aspergillus granulosus]|uniref:Uncharacterized protein n=1 Tax=Aspergillus granulosus TaxID=176169 RepID=A0ABR4GTV4_9EURO